MEVNQMAISINDILTNQIVPELTEAIDVPNNHGMIKKFTYEEDADNRYYLCVLQTSNAKVTVHVTKAKTP
jgi:hypothetical protein